MTVHSEIRLGALAPVHFLLLDHCGMSSNLFPLALSFPSLKKKKLFWLHRVFIAACTGSVIVAPGLSCNATCGILVPQPGTEPRSPALEGGFLATGPQGKSQPSVFLASEMWMGQKIAHLNIGWGTDGRGAWREFYRYKVMHECSIRGAISPHNVLFKKHFPSFT